MQPDMGSSSAEQLVTAGRQCSQVKPAQLRPQEVQKSQGQPPRQAELSNVCGQLQPGGHAQTVQELETYSHVSNGLQQSSAGLQQCRHDVSIASEGLQLEQATTVRKSSQRAADDCLDDPEACRRRKSQKRNSRWSISQPLLTATQAWMLQHRHMTQPCEMRRPPLTTIAWPDPPVGWYSGARYQKSTCN